MKNNNLVSVENNQLNGRGFSWFHTSQKYRLIISLRTSVSVQDTSL